MSGLPSELVTIASWLSFWIQSPSLGCQLTFKDLIFTSLHNLSVSLGCLPLECSESAVSRQRRLLFGSLWALQFVSGHVNITFWNANNPPIPYPTPPYPTLPHPNPEPTQPNPSPTPTPHQPYPNPTSIPHPNFTSTPPQSHWGSGASRGREGKSLWPWHAIYIQPETQPVYQPGAVMESRGLFFMSHGLFLLLIW